MEFETTAEKRFRLKKECKSGARWFYWVAGLSIINEVLLQIFSGWNIALGLGIMPIINGVFPGGLVPAVILAGLFLLFGKMATQGHRWAFLTGSILYTLDGVLFIPFINYIGLGLHVFALFWILRGLRANYKLIEIERKTVKVSKERMIRNVAF
jgi:hypothetical protein